MTRESLTPHGRTTREAELHGAETSAGTFEDDYRAGWWFWEMAGMDFSPALVTKEWGVVWYALHHINRC